MKIQKSFRGISVFLLLGVLLFSQNVFAATTASVTATVTVQNISVTVSTGTVSYGTLALNTSAGTNPASTQTATNNGNITETFNIMGSNSSPGAWTLAATAGANQYVHRFCTATCTTPPTSYTALTTAYQTLKTGVAASGTQTFDLYITTPTSATDFTQQSVNVTVQATQ